MIVLYGDKLSVKVTREFKQLVKDITLQIAAAHPVAVSREQVDPKIIAKEKEIAAEQFKDKPFFFFIHFAEVDHSGHKHGENSKEYNDALISNDTWTGRIMDKLAELGLRARATRAGAAARPRRDRGWQGRAGQNVRRRPCSRSSRHR
mgnify:CR=1 FL=1